MSVTVKLQGQKEIADLFAKLPKQISRDKLWRNFFKKNSQPLVDAAQDAAPLLGDSGNSKSRSLLSIPYPPNKSLRIRRGTLRDSIGFFTTKASRKMNPPGGYVGPRVKGKFSKNKGGYFGAWVHYGNEVMFFGKYTGHAKPYMKTAWERTKSTVTNNSLNDAEKIAAQAMKTFARRTRRYGKFGY
jgi:hypothetical protein